MTVRLAIEHAIRCIEGDAPIPTATLIVLCHIRGESAEFLQRRPMSAFRAESRTPRQRVQALTVLGALRDELQ